MIIEIIGGIRKDGKYKVKTQFLIKDTRRSLFPFGSFEYGQCSTALKTREQIADLFRKHDFKGGINLDQLKAKIPTTTNYEDM